MGLQRRRERGFAPDSPQNREPARFLLLVKFWFWQGCSASGDQWRYDRCSTL